MCRLSLEWEHPSSCVKECGRVTFLHMGWLQAKKESSLFQNPYCQDVAWKGTAKICLKLVTWSTDRKIAWNNMSSFLKETVGTWWSWLKLTAAFAILSWQRSSVSGQWVPCVLGWHYYSLAARHLYPAGLWVFILYGEKHHLLVARGHWNGQPWEVSSLHISTSFNSFGGHKQQCS